MTEHLLVETLYGNFIQYTCPNCGGIIEIYKGVADIFIKNDKSYACEYCGELIKFE